MVDYRGEIGLSRCAPSPKRGARSRRTVTKTLRFWAPLAEPRRFCWRGCGYRPDRARYRSVNPSRASSAAHGSPCGMAALSLLEPNRAQGHPVVKALARESRLESMGARFICACAGVSSDASSLVRWQRDRSLSRSGSAGAGLWPAATRAAVSVRSGACTVLTATACVYSSTVARCLRGGHGDGNLTRPRCRSCAFVDAKVGQYRSPKADRLCRVKR